MAAIVGGEAESTYSLPHFEPVTPSSEAAARPTAPAVSPAPDRTEAENLDAEGFGLPRLAGVGGFARR